MTIQNALPPYQLRCLACGAEWTPERTTDTALQRESERHLKECDTPIAIAPARLVSGGYAGTVQDPESEARPSCRR